MKWIILFFAVLSMSTQAYATNDYDEDCNAINEISRLIMTTRQRGMTMEQSMRIAESNGESSPEVVDLMKKIIIDAYERPRFSTREMQNREIVEFQNHKCGSAVVSAIERQRLVRSITLPASAIRRRASQKLWGGQTVRY